MPFKKVAVVTGSNKGLGYGIVKGLCEKFDGVVYLTSRNETRGKEAVKQLESLGLKPLYHQLDVTDQSSIDNLRKYIEMTHGGLDLLINNAGVRLKGMVPFEKQAEETSKVNYFGVLNVCEALFPLLRKNARVVNISSSSGHLSRIPAEKLRTQFKNPELTVDQLNKLMNKFLHDTKAGTHIQEGWGEITYVVSKVGLSALTFVHQRLFDEEIPKRNISINAVHPGFVNTDMVDHLGPLTIEEGASVTFVASNKIKMNR
nr:carbonyl reductase [NADPH] 1-like [Leptinotarsa decemlineata]